jgi:kynureninase
MALTREQAQAYDAADSLRSCRDRFALPEGVVYLNGNSLGALPKDTPARVAALVEEQWGGTLIGAWNKHGWIDMPQRVGTQVARLIGAKPHEVLACDSTSVNLFKLLMAAAELRRKEGRPGGVLLTESGNFHTDIYIAEGVARLAGLTLEIAPRAEIERRIGRDTALVLLTHVHFKTAEKFDMEAATARAREAGATTVWDLSHSVGAIPVDLSGSGAELAVGCGYKFLNGGPGAPGFLYVAEALQEKLGTPLQGWMGHKAPFAFTDDYAPAPGIDRFLAGTPPILGMEALAAGLDTFDGVTMERLWSKSVALFDIFHGLMERHAPEMACITPIWHEKRGSHISYRHPKAFEICQALIAQGVIGDFRAPDVIRFGITPMYVGAEDLVRAVECLADILRTERWRDPQFAVRQKVT